MNKFKDDPDYGDYKHEEKRDAKREAEQKRIDQDKANFWSQDIVMRDSNNSADTCVWYKGQFIGCYRTLRSANSKAEEIFEDLFLEN
jgi:hypothetical protein